MTLINFTGEVDIPLTDNQISPGTDDAATIQAALNAGQVVALKPNAVFSSETPVELLLNSGNQIIGNNATLDGLNLVADAKQDIILQGFKMTGGVVGAGSGSNSKIWLKNSHDIQIERVTSCNVPMSGIPGVRSILISPRNGSCYNTEIDGCKSIDDAGHGITIGNEPGDTGNAHDIHIRNCRMINNGKATRSDNYVCGINVTDAVAEVYNIFVDGCYVEGAYLNGYHSEDSGIKRNVVIRNCVAKACGQYGFLAHPGMSLDNCAALGNAQANIQLRKTAIDTSVPLSVSNYRGEDATADDIIVNDAGSSAQIILSRAQSYNAGRCGIYSENPGNTTKNIIIRGLDVINPHGWAANLMNNYFSTPIEDSEIEIACVGGVQPVPVYIRQTKNVTLKLRS